MPGASSNPKKQPPLAGGWEFVPQSLKQAPPGSFARFFWPPPPPSASQTSRNTHPPTHLRSRAGTPSRTSAFARPRGRRGHPSGSPRWKRWKEGPKEPQKKWFQSRWHWHIWHRCLLYKVNINHLWGDCTIYSETTVGPRARNHIRNEQRNRNP